MASGRRRERAVNELRAERAQLEMQLVVARVAPTMAVASEATTRTTLKAAKRSAEDHATAAQSAAATATTEWNYKSNQALCHIITDLMSP
jgi:cytochrome c5